MSVHAKEFERLANRNAELLNFEAPEGEPIEETKARSDEFEANLVKLAEHKKSLENEREFSELQKWASTTDRRAATTAPAPVLDAIESRNNPTKSAGTQLLEHEEFKAWMKAIAPNGVLSDEAPIGRSAKFMLDMGLRKDLITGASATSGGAFVQRDYSGIYVPFVQPRLTVRDLVINATTEGDLVEFVRANAHTNVASGVVEATSTSDGLKPEGAFTWAKVTAAVETIAEWVPVTKRALADAGQLRSIIDDQLRYDLAQRLNAQMIEGNGTSPNFRGIRNTTNILTQSFSNNVVETLRKAKTKITDPSTGSGRIPNGAVLTPTSLETLDLFRVGGSTTTDGPFLVNPFGGAERTLWGMALVEEPGMTSTKAVVGFFRDAVLWDREQESVQVYDQHSDYAARNLVMVLAEWRGTFGVLQPKSFCDCTMQ